MIAHAQKPDFVFRAKRTSPFKSAGGGSVQSTTGSRGVRISGSNAGYTMFRGSVKGTGYPLHSPVSPFTSPPVRHPVPSHFNWILQHVNRKPHNRLTLSSYLSLNPPSGLFPSGFPTKTLCKPLLSPYALHAPPISFSHTGTSSKATIHSSLPDIKNPLNISTEHTRSSEATDYSGSHYILRFLRHLKAPYRNLPPNRHRCHHHHHHHHHHHGVHEGLGMFPVP